MCTKQYMSGMSWAPQALLKAARVEEVSSEELLALVLEPEKPDCEPKEFVQRVIACFGTVAALVKSDWRTIVERIRVYNERNPTRPILGLDENAILKLVAAFELARRGEMQEEDFRKTVVNSPAIAAEMFWRQVRGWEEQENFLVLPLDATGHPLCRPLCLSRGSLDSTSVHPREVFKEAIRWGAYSIMVAHNHPSGALKPSRQDKELTKRLKACSQLMQIPLVDHLILAMSQDKVEYLSIGRD